MVDVKNKRCEHEVCMKRGLFGYDGERARFCGTHRLKGQDIGIAIDRAKRPHLEGSVFGWECGPIRHPEKLAPSIEAYQSPRR